MSKTIDTSRRSFLKAGALVAAPAAAIGVPVAAMAEDGSKAALARLQDERAIEALNCDFLRAFNRAGARGTAEFFADRKAPAIARNVSKLSLDLAEAPKSFAIAEDGATATARFDCMIEMAVELEGAEAIVQMARLQGNAASIQTARKTLAASYIKSGDEWQITSIELA